MICDFDWSMNNETLIKTFRSRFCNEYALNQNQEEMEQIKKCHENLLKLRARDQFSDTL